MLIFDGHNDVLKRAYLSGTSFLAPNPFTDIDLPRAKQGDFAGGLFAIMTPAETATERHPDFGLTIREDGWTVDYPRAVSQHFAERFTNRVLDSFLEEAARTPDVSIVTCTETLEGCLATGRLAVLLHLEGAEAIRPDLTNLAAFHAKGIRSIGPVWSRPNAFGYGVPFRFPATPDTGPGLTEAGRQLIAACRELGILVDLAHITERGFWDVAEIAGGPLIVSHANAHAICPSSTNLLDAQIDAIGRSGGIVGILFDVLNTRPDGKLIRDTPIRMLVDHIDYIVGRIGIDHVGLGSDIDGSSTLFNSLRTVERFQFLVETLLECGYTTSDTQKLSYRNWIRVIGNTWGCGATRSRSHVPQPGEATDRGL